MKRTIAVIAVACATLATVAVAAGATDRAEGGAGIERLMGRGEGHGAFGRGPMGEIPSFAELDADGDGQITAADIEARRAARLAEIDANGDGGIDVDEFTAHAAARASARASEMFARLDADGDGVLSADAIAMLAGGPGPQRMLDRADSDNSGGVSEAEFDAAMERLAEMGPRFRGRRGQH